MWNVANVEYSKCGMEMWKAVNVELEQEKTTQTVENMQLYQNCGNIVKVILSY